MVADECSESEESDSDEWNPQEIAAVSLLLVLSGHVTVAVAVADAVAIDCDHYYMHAGGAVAIDC